MRCKFCFSRYSLDYDEIPDKEDVFFIIREMVSTGIEKITFAGGEPLTYPLLDEVLNYSKSLGLVTMIVTNGYLLDEKFLRRCGESIDWIGFSIDSVKNNENFLSGRAHCGKRVLSEYDYLHRINLVKQNGIRLKINTVVSSFNKDTDLTDFIRKAKPERWKIFQCLILTDVNGATGKSCSVTEDEFNGFLHRHKYVSDITTIVSENNKMMKGSYLMIDPSGRLYDNIQGRYRRSDPIQKVGFKEALNQIEIDEDKYLQRKGIYNWK